MDKQEEKYYEKLLALRSAAAAITNQVNDLVAEIEGNHQAPISPRRRRDLRTERMKMHEEKFGKYDKSLKPTL